MRGLLVTFIVVTALHQAAYGVTTFTAKAGTGAWNTAASWTQSGTVDGDGIPDNNDDIIIPSGATITIPAATTLSVTNATIQNGGVLNLNGAGGALQMFTN